MRKFNLGYLPRAFGLLGAILSDGHTTQCPVCEGHDIPGFDLTCDGRVHSIDGYLAVYGDVRSAVCICCGAEMVDDGDIGEGVDYYGKPNTWHSLWIPAGK